MTALRPLSSLVRASFTFESAIPSVGAEGVMIISQIKFSSCFSSTALLCQSRTFPTLDADGQVLGLVARLSGDVDVEHPVGAVGLLVQAIDDDRAQAAGDVDVCSSVLLGALVAAQPGAIREPPSCRAQHAASSNLGPGQKLDMDCAGVPGMCGVKGGNNGRGIDRFGSFGAGTMTEDICPRRSLRQLTASNGARRQRLPDAPQLYRQAGHRDALARTW